MPDTGDDHDDIDDIDDDELLTAWEIQFLASVDSQDFDLTERQQAKLEEIEASLEERRERAGRGR